ncbi:MAG: restriction endonuclease subunit S [Lactobacillus crispatus]
MKTNTLDFDAQALREKILDLAMRGKLVPQDPNDEPASVLLEKIKAEKEQLIKEKKIKKSKPLAPITDDEKPFDIPDSWEWVRLGDICISNIGVTYKPSYKVEEPTKTKILRANNIENNQLNNKKLVFLTLDTLPDKYYLKENDILMAVRSGSKRLVGKSAVVTHDFANYSFGAFMSKIRVIQANSYFVDYFLNSLFFREQLRDANTTTINQITQSMINNFVIPFPPLSEQSRIAAKIAQLFALLRKVESSTQQYAKLQTLLKSKVLDLAMRGKLVEQDPHDEPASVLLEKIKAEKEQLVKEGKIKKSKPLPPITDEEKPFDIPDSWEWGRLGDILKPEVHKKPVKDFYYIDIASIDNQYNKVVNPKKVIVKKDKIASRARQVLENDDILFSVVRPYLRNIAMVPKDNNYKIGTTGFYVLKPYELINRKYIFCLTLSNYTVTNMTQKMRGDNSPSIRKSDMQNLIIPIPPRMEQDKIVNMIIRIYSAINLN